MNPLTVSIAVIPRATRLAFSQEIRPFVILPLLLNILIFGLLIWFAASHLNAWLEGYSSGADLTGWLAFLNPVIDWLVGALQVLVWALLLMTGAYFFSTIAQLISAPFNGLLSEKVDLQQHLRTLPEPGFFAMFKRTLSREGLKWAYWGKRALLLGLLSLPLSFIPGINLLVPVIWFLFGSWMMALEYLDYSADNRGEDFASVNSKLKGKRLLTLCFGAITFVLTMIPLVNLVIIPIAVVAGTLLWHEEYQQ